MGCESTRMAEFLNAFHYEIYSRRHIAGTETLRDANGRFVLTETTEQ